MEELGEGVMYFKKLNVLDRSDHVPLVRKNWREESKGERKAICWDGNVPCGKRNKRWVCD